MDQDFVSATAPVVFVQVESTGRHAALTSMPLHEAVIARQRVEESSESLIIHDAWPSFAADSQVLEGDKARSLRDEYARLQRNYGRELVIAVYGQPHEGRLRKVMMRIHAAFKAGHKPSKIIALGSPDGDFIDLPNGGSIQADAARPTQPAVVDKIAVDSDAATKVDSSVLSKLNAEADADGAKPLGGDDVPEEKPVDGALVEFLTENGWNEPQAAAVGRLVRDKGIQSLSDADLSSIPGVKNAEARKSLRQHFNEYRAQKSAPARA